MLLATHYYRPPFPENRFWARDIAKMKASGLDALQIWVTWAWVEAEPGVYRFDDYDAIFDEAEKQGLGVIVSTLGELQPEWIHRLVPDGTMIDHMGNRVISSHRIESNFGLTPGCCTDHPEVAQRMGAFLKATAEHFKNRPNLVSWDIWNETRWNIHPDGYVCHCHNTLAAFRNWLKGKHGDLDGLNKAWHRRYTSWEDVYPGKLPNRPYTEMMAFSAFLQYRSEEHMRFRNKIFRDAGVTQPVGAHGPAPSVDQAGMLIRHQTPVCRGSDWEHAKVLDSYGASFFPLWHSTSLSKFMLIVDSLKTATQVAGNKTLWIYELQGGAANYGHTIGQPVRPELQQQWLWCSVACGAKAAIFWSWSNEVFGREATGFGISARDGLAQQRLDALAKLSSVWRKNSNLLDAYEPDRAEVGVWFAPENYQLEAAETGQAEKAHHANRTWLGVFEQAHQYACVVTPAYLDSVLPNLKLLVLPCANVIEPAAVPKLLAWVEAGGTLVCEAETDAWTADGFYRAEPEDRPLMQGLGFAYIGRRPGGPTTIELSEGDKKFSVEADWFQTPLEDLDGGADILARNNDGEILAMRRTLGKGRVYALGFYAGVAITDMDAPYEEQSSGLRNWLKHLLAVSGTGPQEGSLNVSAPAHVRWRTGRSGNRTLLFLVNDSRKDTQVEVCFGKECGESVYEILTGDNLPLDTKQSLSCSIPADGIRVLCTG